MPALLVIGLGAYILIAGTTGSCSACSAVTNALGIGGKSPGPSANVEKPDAMAPQWAGMDIEGNPVSTERLEGTVYLVDFWATWCGPCKRMVPNLVELERKYGDRGFKVVGISLDQTGPSAVRSFNERHGVSYPTLMATQGIISAFGKIRAIPTSFLIDREGRIVSRHVGYVSLSALENEITPLL